MSMYLPGECSAFRLERRRPSQGLTGTAFRLERRRRERRGPSKLPDLKVRPITKDWYQNQTTFLSSIPQSTFHCSTSRIPTFHIPHSTFHIPHTTCGTVVCGTWNVEQWYVECGM